MKIENHDLKKPMEKQKGGAVTVVRGDGKKFLIQRAMVAEHINRGFTVEDPKDQPSEQELKDATQFGKGAAAAGKETKPAAPTVPEEKPLDKWTVAELQAEATRLELEFAASAKKADLIELISVKRQETA
tara:strand:- start:79 stop:468 length:390 start_codon:yes stop_codon:yes gene_type:complete